ncbi:hypothetical protein E2C01_034431 [Portunus trituberculatus]|uniref:Uncharacterized protein n=1 Tax=Portunus trituberculatus TaxID=210409 RepID=A0A5B7F6Y6_PORTR|nr:hypothetical protein [Portunus trituberculatus]
MAGWKGGGRWGEWRGSGDTGTRRLQTPRRLCLCDDCAAALGTVRSAPPPTPALLTGPVGNI